MKTCSDIVIKYGRFLDHFLDHFIGRRQIINTQGGVGWSLSVLSTQEGVGGRLLLLRKGSRTNYKYAGRGERLL